VQTPRWPRVWRTYSIANAPSAGDPSAADPSGDPGDDPGGGSTLTLHVRAVPGGLVSTTLLHASPGDQLVIGPAEGTMTPDPAGDRDILCLAGGTGLAPVKAIAEAVARQGTAESRGGTGRKIALYFGARTEADLYDLPALRAMESHYPGLRVHTAISDVPSPGALNSPGTMNDTIPNLAVHAEWRDRDVYISGPTPMITRTVHSLRQLGAPAERLHYDLPS
jgi:NAD(P)H-flavin reductase